MSASEMSYRVAMEISMQSGSLNTGNLTCQGEMRKKTPEDYK